MTSPTGFVAAAAAALAVSVGAAGFLAARRSHAGEAATPPLASVEPAPAPAQSPVPPVSPVTEAVPAPAPEKTAQPEKIVTTAPIAKAPVKRTAKAAPSRRPAEAPKAPALPPLEPVVEATPPPSLPPSPPPVADPTPASTPPPAPVVEAPPVETQKPRFDELTVKADSVVGVELDQALSSATSKIEDRVLARVSRDVTVGGRTVLPTGTKVEGTVMLVEPGSKFKGRARLGIRFHTIVLADGQRVPIQTEALYRTGDSATNSTATKVGTGAAAGAILGAVIGGKRGAIIGAGVGAGGGTAAVMAGDRKEAVLPSGTSLTMRLTNPVTLTIERDPSIR